MYANDWPYPYARLFWSFGMHCWTRATILTVAHLHWSYSRGDLSIGLQSNLPVRSALIFLIRVLLGGFCIIVGGSPFSYHLIFRTLLNDDLGWHFLTPERDSPLDACLNNRVPSAACVNASFLSSLANGSMPNSSTYSYTYDPSWV